MSDHSDDLRGSSPAASGKLFSYSLFFLFTDNYYLQTLPPHVTAHDAATRTGCEGHGRGRVQQGPGRLDGEGRLETRRARYVFFSYYSFSLLTLSTGYMTIYRIHDYNHQNASKTRTPHLDATNDNCRARDDASRARFFLFPFFLASRRLPHHLRAQPQGSRRIKRPGRCFFFCFLLY